MTILKIARMGNPVLLRRADPVEDPTVPEIGELANDMRETLEDIGANGLAATQVHEPLRIFVYRITARQIPACRGGRAPRGCLGTNHVHARSAGF